MNIRLPITNKARILWAVITILFLIIVILGILWVYKKPPFNQGPTVVSSKPVVFYSGVIEKIVDDTLFLKVAKKDNPSLVNDQVVEVKTNSETKIFRRLSGGGFTIKMGSNKQVEKITMPNGSVSGQLSDLEAGVAVLVFGAGDIRGQTSFAAKEIYALR